MSGQIRFCTTSDGVRIAYTTVGEGPPLVIVPGWVSHQEIMAESPLWRSLIEEYAKHLQVISYDKRGTGLSDRRMADYSVEARLRDLEAVVDALKLKRVAVEGISEGGPVAIAYAAHNPRRVSALVLYGTFARGPGLAASDEQRRTIDAIVSLVRAEWGLGSRTLSNIFVPDGLPEEVAWFVRIQEEGAAREDAAAMLLANMESDVSDLLPKVRAPTLVVHARGDRAVPFERGREVAGGIQGAQLLALEGNRHIPDEATAAQMRQAIIDFILEHQPAAAPQKSPESASGAPVTILFTDISSSTSHTQRLGDSQAQELVRVHNAIVRDALKQHAGSEIKHTGDGIMASFPSASRALDCAAAIQRAVAARDDERLAVHVGLNAGEPIVEDDDLFGTSIQLARRICDQAGAGEILASDVVRQLVAGKGFLFADRGEVALRGFEDPARLYEVRWREDG